MKKHKSEYAAPNSSKKVWQDKKILFLAACLIAFVSYVAGTREYEWQSFIGQALNAPSSSEQIDLRSLEQTYQALQQHYAGKLDKNKLVDGANKGLVEAAGDDYTVYLTAKEAKELDDELEGEHGSGIGAQLGIRNEVPTVIRVLPGNAAQKAGIHNGDQIIEVNDEDVLELPLDQVVAKILGKSGTTVKLKIVRDGSPKTFSITREEINDPSVYSTVEDGIGILTISRFDTETAMLAKKEAKRLLGQDIDGLIVDLRGDGGGYLDGAVDVAGLWINDKTIVTQRKDDKIIDTLKSGKDALLENTRTVVLVDQGTASASEIVAGALRDYGKATLVGEKTFGKGSVQGMYGLSGGAKLKVTIARWYTPDGNNVTGKGLTPDVTVKITSKDLDAGKDPQLDAAKQQLKRQ